MSSEVDNGTGPDDSRRGFIRRMALAGAFAAPVVSSFTMDGLMSPAVAQASNLSGGSNVR